MVIELRTGVDEHPYQPRRPAEAREVRERIRPRRRRQSESTVEQAVPDL